MLFYVFIFQGEHPHHMLARNKPSKDIIDAFKVLLNNECVELDLTTFNNDGQTVTDIAQDKGDLISECTYFHFGPILKKVCEITVPQVFTLG